LFTALQMKLTVRKCIIFPCQKLKSERKKGT
jgi:hypothetical protein